MIPCRISSLLFPVLSLTPSCLTHTCPHINEFKTPLMNESRTPFLCRWITCLLFPVLPLTPSYLSHISTHEQDTNPTTNQWVTNSTCEWVTNSIPLLLTHFSRIPCSVSHYQRVTNFAHQWVTKSTYQLVTICTYEWVTNSIPLALNLSSHIRTTRGGGLGSSTIFKNLMSPTPRRKWYLSTGRRAH